MPILRSDRDPEDLVFLCFWVGLLCLSLPVPSFKKEKFNFGNKDWRLEWKNGLWPRGWFSLFEEDGILKGEKNDVFSKNLGCVFFKGEI